MCSIAVAQAGLVLDGGEHHVDGDFLREGERLEDLAGGIGVHSLELGQLARKSIAEGRTRANMSGLWMAGAKGLTARKYHWATAGLRMHNFFSVAYVGALAVTVSVTISSSQHLTVAVPDRLRRGAPRQSRFRGGLRVRGAGDGRAHGRPGLAFFAAITESAGCFLTGFCVSMWFLSLVDGGLIRSRAGKTVFITAMSGAFGAVGLVRYTRHRLLLFGIPFSAATAIVLGIDCFTLAGLKGVLDLHLGSVLFPSKIPR